MAETTIEERLRAYAERLRPLLPTTPREEGAAAVGGMLLLAAEILVAEGIEEPVLWQLFHDAWEIARLDATRRRLN